MKKVFTYLIILAVSLSAALSQVGTADIAIENPRIEAGNFYFDIYFKRTNDVSEWYIDNDPINNPYAFYKQSSWVVNMTTSAFTGAVVVYEDPTYIQGKYSTSVSFEGALGRVNITSDRISGQFPNFPFDNWIHAYTVEMAIGNTGLNSGVTWNLTGTNLTTPGNTLSVDETLYDSDCDIALNTNCWTGNISGDWDQGGNWSSGIVPTSSDDIIYPNNPTGTGLLAFNVSTAGSVNNLRVNHLATLTVPINKGLVVSGNVELKGGINIILDAGDGLGTLSSAFIPEGTINYNAYALEAGHIEVHRTLYYENTDLGYYHHQVAAPVGGVTLGDWDMIHEYSYAYEFQADQSWFNIYEPTRPTNPGYGFILSLYGSSGFPTSTQDVIFYDNLVLNIVNPAINPGDNIVSLIGNPYTAPISWDYMITDGTNNMENVVYVWNPAAGNYATYVSTGSGTGNQSARYIQPGQAFFVEARDNAPVFSITPGARTTNIEPYLKSAPQNSLRVYTAGGNSTYDETYIRFVDADVSGGYDSDWDAREWPSSYGEDATEIFTVGTDGQYLAIDSRPLTPELMSVQLSFKPAIEAEYTLAVDVESMQSFSPGTEIFLEDTHIPSQAWIDLKEFPEYTFNAAPQDNYARFIVHFHIKDFGIDELAEKPISIFGERTDAIIKNNSGQRINEIQVYDIAGNLMSAKAGITHEVTRMFVSSNTGYYVIKVITDKAVYSEKVLITK